MDNKIESALQSLYDILNSETIEASSSAQKTIQKTISTSDYLKAYDLAEIEYERIRNDYSDIEKISNNLDKDSDVVERVKNHIFFNEHEIHYQDSSVRFGRLDADPAIVNAWDRIVCDNCIDTDYHFFAHEEYESLIAQNDGVTYNEAHNLTIEAGFIWDPKEE
ncbi:MULTISPECIES: hypothetical protein [Klebsiella pneumoniae complex]|uniref:hypothetical protein n=1 Tax=Klebsiella pneumoniae complex TaxID=3390273 RepID=UPI000E2B04DD|nr:MULTISPECIES: hypothetical protein [Klebsiella]MBC4641743.1 hypothetical protein [Klebsiella quasipneumoniae]MBC4693669.1 hypothetical protein [Klebsiella quasipneumoniae]MBC4720368.1 hypothetical protein [Klebsiella quasipneumoniae]MCF2453011.1 hypothetical protein [Klebsiella pneumoniae]MDL4002836.1 hypothetical protein [Klebsiella quasipneumoniae]